MKYVTNSLVGRFRFCRNPNAREKGASFNFWLLALAASLALAAGPAQAGNLLVNPGFEANSGHVIAAGWTYFSPPPPTNYFGDYWVDNAVPAHSGTNYWKEWGALYLSAPTNNVAGIYQSFSSTPGSIYQASGWFYTSAGDVLGADCVTWLEVDFLNASSNLLAVYKSDNFSASVGTDTWFQYQVNNACNLSSPVATGDPYFTTYAVTGSVSQLVAPPGTATVRYRYAYLQSGTEGGSAYLDDAVLNQISGPVTGIAPPTGLVIQSGDRSVVLHWNPNTETSLSGYQVYRSTNSGGPFVAQSPGLLTTLGFCDLSVNNGQTYFYQVTALTTNSLESLPSSTYSTVPNPFASDDAFLDYVQQANFDYFWYAANPANGLVPDRTATGSACSIAAVGFGLTAIGIGIDHGWITRTQGVARVLTTLNTFLQKPQGTNSSGIIGYKGWFYHFLNMNTAWRAPNSELSSIDTTLLLSGILYAKQYFNGTNSDETSIRTLADAIFKRVDWNWMAQGTSAVAMGWQPTTGFSGFGNWIGYDEAMILYLLGLGATTNPLPASAWTYWTSGYTWATNYGQAYIPFPPLFGYQYSHCWVDFRHVGDSYINSHNSTYFENSRRATLAQLAYCIANPSHWPGYGSNVWGLTACDDPTGYGAHGAPPAQNDNGTIAPTAAGGSIAFAPEYCLPTLKYFYSQFRTLIWTEYGFHDAFNLHTPWFDTDELGIDQGPIVIMIENYRTQRVWKLFMQNVEVQRGLNRAGFVTLPFVDLKIQELPAQNAVSLTWAALAGRTYQIEYSNNLNTWFVSPAGQVVATGSTASWTNSSPPNPPAQPSTFYRVLQFGPP